jgi:hypothetical protein
VIRSSVKTNAVPEDSDLSKSLLGHRYQTTRTVALQYAPYDGVWILTDWKEPPWFGSPKRWACYLKIEKPIRFEIVALKRTCISSENQHLQVHIKLLDDISFDDVIDYLEADLINERLVKYIHKSSFHNMNPHLNTIIDHGARMVRTKDFLIRMDTYPFLNCKRSDIKDGLTISIKGSLQRL